MLGEGGQEEPRLACQPSPLLQNSTIITIITYRPCRSSSHLCWWGRWQKKGKRHRRRPPGRAWPTPFLETLPCPPPPHLSYNPTGQGRGGRGQAQGQGQATAQGRFKAHHPTSKNALPTPLPPTTTSSFPSPRPLRLYFPCPPPEAHLFLQHRKGRGER